MIPTLLKAALMALGAGCVLLFAGGFPLLGAPALYHGGAMLLLGAFIALLSLWGAFRLARGQIVRLVCGLFCCFMAGIGLVMILQYGGKALDYAMQGGVMWFGFVGMGCVAATGVIFLGVFAFLASRLMLPRLWLAGAHAACFLVLLGAFLDYSGELAVQHRQPVDGKTELTHISTEDGAGQELPFRLRVDEFAVEHYEGSGGYSLLSFDHASARWKREGTVALKGGQLVFGQESWPAEHLRSAPGMPRPFLVAGQGRVIVQDEPLVREYRAKCHIKTKHRGRDEARDEWLRVNEPLAVKGWQISLMSHERMADGSQQLTLQVRRAPGRFWALTGMLGIILCTACWCWQVSRGESGKEQAHA